MRFQMALGCIALGLGLLTGCGGGDNGTVSVTLQDAPVNAEKVEVTLSEVSVHFVPKSGTDKTTDADPAVTSDDPALAGWRNVLPEPKAFDLLTLKDNPTALGDLALAEGKITQIRLIVAADPAPTVTVSGTAYPMDMPSGSVKIVGNFDVAPGVETKVALDFDASESVSETGAGKYKMTPTVKLVK